MTYFREIAEKVLDIPYKNRDTEDKLDGILREFYNQNKIGGRYADFVRRLHLEMIVLVLDRK